MFTCEMPTLLLYGAGQVGNGGFIRAFSMKTAAAENNADGENGKTELKP